MQLQTRWKSILDAILGLPQSQAILLKGVALINGTTIVSHKLGRVPQGWIVVDANAAATIYRSADFNETTLALTSNAAVTVTLEVF